MIDLQLIIGIASFLRDEFPDVFIGQQHSSDPITLPACLIDMRGDAVVGGPLYKADLVCQIASQADETTSEEHSSLVLQIGQTVNALLGDFNGCTIAGVVANTSESSRNERHFMTTLTFIVGYHLTGAFNE